MANQLPPPPFLFPDDVIEEIEKAEAQGNFTLERLKPEKRDAIIKLIAEGKSERETAQLVSVSRNTVALVADAYPLAINEQKQRRLNKLNRAGDALLEKIIEHPDLVPWPSKALSIGILYDQAGKLEGRPTEIIEHRHTRVDPREEWEQFLSGQILEAEIVPESIEPLSGPETGLVDQKKPAIERDPVSAIGDRTDSGSEHSVDSAQVDRGADTVCDTESEPKSGRLEARGGGVEPAQTPAKASTRNSKQKISDNGPLLL